MKKEKFEKENVFGLGVENSAYAQYFMGVSYLNPLTDPNETVFLANVSFEPGSATIGISIMQKAVAVRF